MLTTLGLEQSFIYTNPIGTLSANTATATLSMNLPAPIAAAVLGRRIHHVALIFDPANPTVGPEVTNAVWVDIVP